MISTLFSLFIGTTRKEVKYYSSQKLSKKENVLSMKKNLTGTLESNLKVEPIHFFPRNPKQFL